MRVKGNDWQTESDLSILRESQRIQADKKRMAAARKLAAQKADEYGSFAGNGNRSGRKTGRK